MNRDEAQYNNDTLTWCQIGTFIVMMLYIDYPQVYTPYFTFIPCMITRSILAWGILYREEYSPPLRLFRIF